MSPETEKRTLYIGNLDKNVTEELLYELFLQAGPIDKVTLCGPNSDSFRYGFVTYKHEVSIDYALKLYDGTTLYKKEIVIKRKGARNQQPVDFIKYGGQDELPLKKNVNMQQIADGLRAFIQKRAKTCSSLLNFAPEPPVQKGNWSNRKKPYDRNQRNHFSRFRESRDRHKDKDYGNKMHHNRKNRH